MALTFHDYYFNIICRKHEHFININLSFSIASYLLDSFSICTYFRRASDYGKVFDRWFWPIVARGRIGVDISTYIFFTRGLLLADFGSRIFGTFFWKYAFFAKNQRYIFCIDFLALLTNTCIEYSQYLINSLTVNSLANGVKKYIFNAIASSIVCQWRYNFYSLFAFVCEQLTESFYYFSSHR